jgi:hypothetical protein
VSAQFNAVQIDGPYHLMQGVRIVLASKFLLSLAKRMGQGCHSAISW